MDNLHGINDAIKVTLFDVITIPNLEVVGLYRSATVCLIIYPQKPTDPIFLNNQILFSIDPSEIVLRFTSRLLIRVNEAWFLESKRQWGRRGVKVKNKDVAAKDGVSPSVTDEITVKEKQSSLVDTTVEMDKLSSLDDTTVLGSFPPLSTLVTTTACNTPSKSSYANVTGKPSGKKLICLHGGGGGNGIDVVVPVESIRTISDHFANTTYGFFLGKLVAYLVVVTMLGTLENGPWFIWNNPLILKKWHPDENLLKEDVSTIPVWFKLHGVPVTAFRDDGLSAINTKLGFKPQKEYRPVPKKPNASSSGNKKKGVEPTIEVSNSNPFDVLNSVDNDVEFGYGTNSLLEQWRDSYPYNDDYDPYDDDMYENHDLSEHL
nr:hypothetical protein [Tanacetum cinerariifolium]